MSTFSESEKKQITLLKCWIKLSTCGGGMCKCALETFEKDWEKLQEDIVNRVGIENDAYDARLLTTKAMTEIENYIKELKN